MAGCVVLLHVAGAALLVAGGWHALTVAVLVFAWSRGLLHALDADHLAMIDNSTRRLLARGRPTAGVGLAFSLGHSSVVLAAGVAVVAGAGWVREAIGDTPTAHWLGIIGGSVSVVYLVGVALANLPLLWRRPSPAEHRHAPLAGLLAAPLGRVEHAWQVYVVGVLFGLGFDTASTVGLLMLTAAQAGAGAASLLALPVLFTAAMTLGDSLNAWWMQRVYTTAAHRHPATNRGLVAVSVASALLVASVTLASMVAELGGPTLAWGEVDTRPVTLLLLGCALAGGLLLARQLLRRA